MQNLLDVSALLAEGKTDPEQFSDLLKQPGIRLERIVSFGQVTAEGSGTIRIGMSGCWF